VFKIAYNHTFRTHTASGFAWLSNLKMSPVFYGTLCSIDEMQVLFFFSVLESEVPVHRVDTSRPKDEVLDEVDFRIIVYILSLISLVLSNVLYVFHESIHDSYG